MKEWGLRIGLAVVTTALGVGVTTWINTPAAEPPEVVKKLVASLEEGTEWERTTDRISGSDYTVLVKKDNTTKVTIGTWWATIHTRKPAADKDRDYYSSDRSWFEVKSLSRSDLSKVNAAANNAVKAIELQDLSR